MPSANQLIVPTGIKTVGSHLVGNNLQENGSYLGIPLIILLVTVVARYWRKLWTIYLALLLLTVFALSLGPVLIVDEASMLSTVDLDRLTAHATTTKSTLILVGDPAQIGAVNTAGGMLEVLANRFGPRVVELSELHRFTHPWESLSSFLCK